MCYSNCDRLDVLVGKVPAIGGRRENWKIKVDQMKADVRSLQSDYSSFQGLSLGSSSSEFSNLITFILVK